MLQSDIREGSANIDGEAGSGTDSRHHTSEEWGSASERRRVAGGKMPYAEEPSGFAGPASTEASQ
jgi:hypothetical protein